MENFERQVTSEIFLHSHTFDLLLIIYILDQKETNFNIHFDACFKLQFS